MNESNRGELERLIARIVDIAQPLYVYLFGSRARGEAQGNSDYDFLIVEDRPVHTRRESARIRRHLRGFSVPIDILVARLEQFERYKNQPGLIYHKVLDEGTLCYARE